MPLTEEFIELLRLPTEEITQTINEEFLQENDAKEILRFVGDPWKSFVSVSGLSKMMRIFLDPDPQREKQLVLDPENECRFMS